MRRQPVSLPKSIDQFLQKDTPAPEESLSESAAVTSGPQFLSEGRLHQAQAAALLIKEEFGITISSWATVARTPQSVINTLYRSGQRRVTEAQLSAVAEALRFDVEAFLTLGEKDALTEQERTQYWEQMKQNVGEYGLRTYSMGKRRAWR